MKNMMIKLMSLVALSVASICPAADGVAVTSSLRPEEAMADTSAPTVAQKVTIHVKQYGLNHLGETDYTRALRHQFNTLSFTSFEAFETYIDSLAAFRWSFRKIIYSDAGSYSFNIELFKAEMKKTYPCYPSDITFAVDNFDNEKFIKAALNPVLKAK